MSAKIAMIYYQESRRQHDENANNDPEHYQPLLNLKCGEQINISDAKYKN